jgi:outer membrane protein
MKKFLIYLVFFFSYFSNIYANNNTYFMDVDFLLNNSKPGKIIIDDLKKIKKKNLLDLKTQENKLKDLELNITKVKNIISEEELKSKISILKKEITLFRAEKEKKSQEFNILKDKKIKDFFTKITPLIENFMKNNSIDIIVDKKNIFIANSKYDITDKIIKIINDNNN